MPAKLKTIGLRALRVIGLLIFFGWWLFVTLTAWIGRSTVLEDSKVATTRADEFLDWLLSTPGWVPASLAIICGLLVIFPSAFVFALNAMRGKAAAEAASPDIPESRAPTLKYSPPEPPAADPAVQPPPPTLQNGQMRSPTIAAPTGGLVGIGMRVQPERIYADNERRRQEMLAAEGEPEKKAKEDLGRLCKGTLYEAGMAQHMVITRALSTLGMRFKSGRIKSALTSGGGAIEGFDLNKAIGRLQNATSLRQMTLNEAETAVYDTFAWYERRFFFLCEIIEEIGDPGDQIDGEYVDAYAKWCPLDLKLYEELTTLGNNFEYGTIPRIFKQAPRSRSWPDTAFTRKYESFGRPRPANIG